MAAESSATTSESLAWTDSGGLMADWRPFGSRSFVDHSGKCLLPRSEGVPSPAAGQRQLRTSSTTALLNWALACSPRRRGTVMLEPTLDVAEGRLAPWAWIYVSLLFASDGAANRAWCRPSGANQPQPLRTRNAESSCCESSCPPRQVRASPFVPESASRRRHSR